MRRGVRAGRAGAALIPWALVPLALLAALPGCVASGGASPAPEPRPLTPMEAALYDHVAALSSDAFGGRAPGTIGERMTLDYLQTRLVEAGLQSGTHDPRHPWLEPFSYTDGGETISTHNLVARLPGTEPQAGAVLLMAHWDHLGTGSACRRSREPGRRDDRICNGAVDNATGLAMMIEIARGLAAGPQPRRDIYFLATGAEEPGLHGASAFIAAPPVPLEKFVAVLNLDTEGVAPAGGPAVVLAEEGVPGAERLASLIAGTAADTGVTLVSPTSVNRRFLRRQDGWLFGAQGVPSAIVSAAFADERRLAAYLRHHYHRASDEAGRVELGATARMTAFHVALLHRAADPDFLPRSTPSQIPATAP